MEKKKIWMYVAIAYGVTAVMSLVMYVAYRRQINTTTFVNVQMMYPACGVILGKLIFREDEKVLPVAGYITVLATTAIMMIVAVLSVAAPIAPIKMPGTEIELDIWNTVSQLPIIGGSIIAYILFWVCGKEKRENAGIERKNIKLSIVLVALFVALFIGKTMIAVFIEDAIAGNNEQWSLILSALSNPLTWVSVVVLPVNFILSFIAFFGEEYGWRYYLHPVMQKRFGKRVGVLLLGLVWAVWHINVDFMYYASGYGLQAFLCQIITCVAIAIFFGYAYMKTENIWVPIIMHYLNNNIAALLSGGGQDALMNQVVEWREIPVVAVSFILFFLFILVPVYNKTCGSTMQEGSDA
ncbi:MAG: CPBP family intramembrane metalloprotease [Lachnospiraceae bacterium]|nr:CPBP family intramembrane metalloprotease [Lachnospiraceae bacterium]